MHPDRVVPPALAGGGDGGEHRLPRGRLVRRAGLAAEREHDRVVGQRDRAAPERRILHEDELAGAELVLVAVDREARATAEDEVDLLMTERRLGVLLDDLARRPGCVRVHAERTDVEPAPHGPPHEAVVQLDPVELVDVHVRHPKSSCQRGSDCRRVEVAVVGRVLADHVRTRARARRRRCANAASSSPASASKHAALYGALPRPGMPRERVRDERARLRRPCRPRGGRTRRRSPPTAPAATPRPAARRPPGRSCRLSAAVASRSVPGVACTSVPAGASNVSSPRVNVARPRTTTYSSSSPSCSRWRSITWSPGSAPSQALTPKGGSRACGAAGAASACRRSTSAARGRRARGRGSPSLTRREAPRAPRDRSAPRRRRVPRGSRRPPTR